MGLAGILLALALLIWLAYRGWSVLLAPVAALLAAAISGEPLLAHGRRPSWERAQGSSVSSSRCSCWARSLAS